MADKQEFKFPTETIDLPSGGKLYPKESLLASGKIEIKYMTAKEEDILTSSNLIEKGLVIDKLLESVIANPKVKLDDMLVGDKNALMLGTRVLGYGKDYVVKITDPDTDLEIEHTFDLTELKTKKIEDDIFKSGKNLNSVKKIKEYFDALTSVEYFTDSWPLNNNKNWCVVVGNNDWVGFGAKNGNTKKYCAFDCSIKGAAFITGPSRRYLDWQDFAGSTTTSYSAENGNQYYTKFNTTWDGKWGIIYSPYYYYGPGINAFAMSLENPRKFISINQTKSDYPNPYTAWGRTGFHGGCSHNTDSTTWRTFAWQFDSTDSDHTVDTKVYMGGSSGDGINPDNNSHVGGTYTNKTGNCSLSNSYTQITGGYYSTCYPQMMGINWWGAYGSADQSYGGN